jgi:hypothetical protein
MTTMTKQRSRSAPATAVLALTAVLSNGCAPDRHTVGLFVEPPTHTASAQGCGPRFQAIAIFSDGTSDFVTAETAWVSSVATVATVAVMPPVPDGLATLEPTCVGTGVTTITGTYDGVSASAVLTIVP